MKSVEVIRGTVAPIVLSLATLSLPVLGACQHESHAEEEAPTFQVTHPLKKDAEIISDYVCQIHAIQHIELRAMERGYLQGIYVDEGQELKTGQRMFQIMPMLYQAELQRAEAEKQFAQIEFSNTEKLANGNVVSGNELALAKAKLDKAHAEVSLAKVHRGLTEIKAPFDGIMDRMHVRLGSLVDEGELLTTLSDNSTLWVYFNVTEAEYLDYKAAKAHGPVEVQLEMANGKIFDHKGKIETIEAEFNHETGTIAFRANFPNPEGLLRHGETGKVLMTTVYKDAILVPQKATFEILDRKYVYLIGEDKVVHAQEIQVAAELPHVYVVSDGLAASDTILLDGLRKVRDGDAIQTAEQDPAEVFSHLDVPAE